MKTYGLFFGLLRLLFRFRISLFRLDFQKRGERLLEAKRYFNRLFVSYYGFGFSSHFVLASCSLSRGHYEYINAI